MASHIVPWSEAKDIRLDPSNGVCLSTFVDRAFDAGYLAITPEGRTAVRWERVTNDPILKLELSKIDDVELAKPDSDPPDPAKLAKRIDGLLTRHGPRRSPRPACEPGHPAALGSKARPRP